MADDEKQARAVTLLEHRIDKLETAILDVLHDPLCCAFTRDKLRRVLTNQPPLQPVDGNRYNG